MFVHLPFTLLPFLTSYHFLLCSLYIVLGYHHMKYMLTFHLFHLFSTSFIQGLLKLGRFVPCVHPYLSGRLLIIVPIVTYHFLQVKVLDFVVVIGALA